MPCPGPFAPAALRLRLDHPAPPGHNRPGGRPDDRPAAGPPARPSWAALGVGLAVLAVAAAVAVLVVSRAD